MGAYNTFNRFDDDNGDNDGKREISMRFLHLPNGTGGLESLGALRRVPKGVVLTEPGDTVDHCYVVRRGCVIGYDITPAGGNRIYSIALDNSLLLEVCAILGRPSPVFLKTIKDTELISIPRKVFINEIQRNQRVAMLVIESLCRKYSSVTEQIREIKCHSAAWKLCNLFLIFADTYGEPRGGKTIIKEKINQQILSDLLGINRITTVRVIVELKSHKLIEKLGGFYCIPNREDFLDYMDFLETKEMKDA